LRPRQRSHAGPLDHHRGLVTDRVPVVAGRDVVDVVRAEFENRAVAQEGAQTARDDDADVAGLAPFAADERFAVARLFEFQGTEAAAIDLDLVYEMLEHDRAPRKENLAIWGRARRAAAALTDALLEDGVGVVVVEGDFLSQEERADF